MKPVDTRPPIYTLGPTDPGPRKSLMTKAEAECEDLRRKLHGTGSLNPGAEGYVVMWEAKAKDETARADLAEENLRLTREERARLQEDLAEQRKLVAHYLAKAEKQFGRAEELRRERDSLLVTKAPFRMCCDYCGWSAADVRHGLDRPRPRGGECSAGTRRPGAHRVLARVPRVHPRLEAAMKHLDTSAVVTKHLHTSGCRSCSSRSWRPAMQCICCGQIKVVQVQDRVGSVAALVEVCEKAIQSGGKNLMGERVFDLPPRLRKALRQAIDSVRQSGVA